MFGTYRRVTKSGVIVWVDLEAQALPARVPPGVNDAAPFLRNTGVIVVERVRRHLTKLPTPTVATFGLTVDVQVLCVRCASACVVRVCVCIVVVCRTCMCVCVCVCV